MTLHLNGI